MREGWQAKEAPQQQRLHVVRCVLQLAGLARAACRECSGSPMLLCIAVLASVFVHMQQQGSPHHHTRLCNQPRSFRKLQLSADSRVQKSFPPQITVHHVRRNAGVLNRVEAGSACLRVEPVRYTRQGSHTGTSTAYLQ
jgi:hypothetical protein